MKKYIILFGFFILALICIEDAYALTPITNGQEMYYYADNDYNTANIHTDMYTSYVSKYNNGLSVGQNSTYVEGALFWFNGINYQPSDTVYLKFNFDFYNSGTCVNSAYVTGFNDVVSIYRVNGSSTDWNTRFAASNVSSSIAQISTDDQRVSVTFSITVNSFGNGFRISWGDNSSNKRLGFANCSRAVYFGIKSVDYQIIQDSNGVIIDQNQTIIDQNNTLIAIGDATNSILNDVKDALTNDNITGSSGASSQASSFFDDFNDMLPSNNTISSLIGLPITLYTKILNSINGTCNSINLGSLYGTNLIMPCINIGNYLGNTLWSTIDLIMSGVFVLIIAKKMVKAFEHFTSFKEGDVINND